VEFLNQNCESTLREGLEELYRHNPEAALVSKEKGKLFIDHDLTHVIFGCDTSLAGEMLLKPWTILGTTISIKEMKKYAADPEIQKIDKEGIALMGGMFKGTLKVIFYYVPQIFWIWLTQVRKMNKKWPHSDITEEMLDAKICDLREEYNIAFVN
jgi:hypothetical protein|tara:strand:+ start:145 stop:609 length:465 start_codon:yes stop_codon:yes gene_type:complete